MSTAKHLTLLGAFALIAGCGTSAAPDPAKPNDPVDAGPEDAPKPAARSLITRPLLSGAPQNLLLDIGFRDAGWGHFTSLFEPSYALVSVTSRVFSLAPAGVTAPVGIFKDPNGDDARSRGMASICSFLGGKGPFIARVWVSRSTAAGAPSELADDPAVFRAAITTGGLPEGKAYDLARKDEKLLGDRTWILFEAKVDAELPSTAFFNLKFGRKGGGFMVTAPEVLALSLLPAADSKMSLEVPVRARAVLPDESGAIAAYLRQPHKLGLDKPVMTGPGKLAPIE